MTVITQTIFLNTTGNTDVQDITNQLADIVARNELVSGIVTVFCPSATSALTTIEYESGAISDLRRLFEEIIPQQREYAHNERWHDGNGHSHIRAAFLGPSLTIPFVDRKLTLGTWQQVIYVDFDVRPRQRQLVVQLIGG
jgi:secondary thiamine-phosphate synthase enzyme